MGETLPRAKSGVRSGIRDNVRVSRWAKVLTWVAALLVVVVIAGFVTGYWTVRRSFPQTGGNISVPGLDAPGQRAARRPRHPADLCRDPARPLRRAGLCAGAGPVLRDGLPPPCHGRSDQRAPRGGRARGRQVRPGFGLATGRRGGAAAAVHRHPALPRVLLRRRQRLPGRSAGQPACRSSTPSSGSNGVSGEPEEWTPVDSLAWLKAMSWNLGSNITDEFERSLDVADLPPDQIAELFPAYPYKENQPIVTQGAVVDGVYEQNATAGGTRLPRRPPPFFDRARDVLERRTVGARRRSTISSEPAPGIGSNAWAVSGDHTASGSPILANDPHLGGSDAQRLVPDGTALQPGRCRVPVRCQRLHVRRLPRCGDRAQRRHRLGIHQPLPRHPGPLPRDKSPTTTRISTTASRCR